MPRTASLQGLSLADLQRAIRDRQRAVSRLERKRAKLLRKLDDLERRIAAVTGSGRVGRGGRRRNATSLPEAIAQVLSQAAGPMNVGDIAEKVQASGYRSGSANFRAIVNQALIKDKRFMSASRGMYQMDGAAARDSKPRARRRTAKRKK
jgi:hypothetical protein